MMRKTMLGATAAVAFSLVALTSTTASAGGPGISIHFGSGGYWAPHYGHGYWGPDCYIKKAKVWSHKAHKFVWKTKEICY